MMLAALPIAFVQETTWGLSAVKVSFLKQCIYIASYGSWIEKGK